MSMRPITPRTFNPVLFGAMAGAVVTTQAVGSLISSVVTYHWIDSFSGLFCNRIVQCSQRTHELTHELVAELVGSRPQQVHADIARIADASHAGFVEYFDPNRFRETALEWARCRECPKTMVHILIGQHFREMFGDLDQIQVMHLKPRTEEWQRVENLKQNLVDLWGQTALASRARLRKASFGGRRSSLPPNALLTHYSG